MVIPEGYKQTEVGVIPEDWGTIAIADVADVKTGPFGSALHANDYVESGVPIITVEHLGETGITRQNLPLVSTKDAKRLSSYMMYQGDIVFSRVGSVDRNAFVTSQEDGWLFSGRILRIRTKSEELNPQFLSYYFKSEPVKYRIRAAAVGQTMASLNTKIMNAFTVAVPTALEQQPIADVLSDIDALITSYEKQLAKKKAIKQGAMQELLTGKRRLPGFEAEWCQHSLEAICFNITDGAHNSPVESSDGFYMPSVKDMTDHSFEFSLCKRISKADYEKLVRSGCNPQKGDVLIAKDGSILKHTFVFDGEQPIVILSSIAIIRPNRDKVYSEYLAQYFKQPSFIENAIANYKTGTGVPRIVLNNFKKIVIRMPSSVDEQREIASILFDMDIEISDLEEKVAKYRQMKQGMMQQLLTGKIRLV